MSVLPDCMSVQHDVPGTQECQKKVLNPLELGLQMIGNYSVGAGTQT